MPLWTLNDPPIWFPSAVISQAGWINPLTQEILIAINNLNSRTDNGGIFAVFLPLNEGSGAVLNDVSGYTRTSSVTDISGQPLVDGVVWGSNPSSLNIIQGTQFGTCFDIGPFTDQLHIVSWSNRSSTFLTDWPDQSLDSGGFYPQNYMWGDPVSGFDLLSRMVVTSGGTSVVNYYTWTDGTDSCIYSYGRDPSILNTWQFTSRGWDFEAGQFLSYTNLVLDIPFSVTGSLPSRNFSFGDQPCTVTFGGFPLSASSLDDTTLGMMMVLTVRPTIEILTNIYNLTKGKFGF